VFKSPAMPAIVAVGIYLLALLTIWLLVAQFLYERLFGVGSPPDLAAFVEQVTRTPEGVQLMIWGNLVGLVFAAIALASAAISTPMLLDRDGGAASAIQTSIRVTFRNPLVIGAWGLIVAA